MPKKPRKIPSYCHHKASGQAVVRINGRDHYLGLYGSEESHERDHRTIAEHCGSGNSANASQLVAASRRADLTIVELMAAYFESAKTYYVKNGKPTSEQTSIRLALRPLKAMYGGTPVIEFGPLALEAVRQRMIDSRITRTRINQHIGRIRRMFKWGVSKELVPVAVLQALSTVEGLRRGRSNAKESKPVRPVAWEHVEATLPGLPRQIQAMIQIQHLVGCRPEEITVMRPCDISRRDQEVWEYVPDSHKTEHHNRQRRTKRKSHHSAHAVQSSTQAEAKPKKKAWESLHDRNLRPSYSQSVRETGGANLESKSTSALHGDNCPKRVRPRSKSSRARAFEGRRDADLRRERF